MSEKKIENSSKFWLIPKEIYEPLNKEFNFDFDPCPYPYKKDGIETSWGKSNWVNPPFRKADAMNGHGPTAFVRKAIEEQKEGKTSVLILPTLGFINLLVEAGAEIRSAGRVNWIDANTGDVNKKWRPSNCTLFILRGYGKQMTACNSCSSLKDKVEEMIRESPLFCKVCGEKLGCCSWGRGREGRACSGMVIDSKNGNKLKWKEGRSPTDEHYSESRVEMSSDTWREWEAKYEVLKALKEESK